MPQGDNPTRRNHSYGYEMPFVYSRSLRLIAILALAAIGVLSINIRSTSAAADRIRIVALGDSLTAGYGLPANSAFPTLLEAALRSAGENVIVDNAGVSGDTTTGALERLDWAIPDDADAVIVELGANDMLRGLPPDIARKTLDQILSKLQQKRVQILVAGMLAAPGLGADYAKSFNAIYPELARKYDAILYPFFLEGLAGDFNLLQKDGLHPNRAGVEKIVVSILPAVRQLIDQARTKGAKN